MKIRFQADANLDPDIGSGILRREQSIDYRISHGVIPDGLSDSDVLRLCAEDDRVLITHDVRTMPRIFEEFIQQQDSPGLLLVPTHATIGEVIHRLLDVWLAWTAEEMRNQIRWLPR